MNKLFKMLIAMIMLSVVLLSTGAPVSADSNSQNAGRPVLKFNADGKFRILMINDTQDTDKPVRDTILLLESALDGTKPDLVVLVGDNIADYWLGVNEDKVAKAIDCIVKPINDRNIPFAVVFGNHDQETGVSKEEQMKMYRSYANCLAVDEGESLSNCGTYNLLIKDGSGEQNIFNLWMMDSGTGAQGGGYEHVNPDQIAWYEKTSVALSNENGGKPLPSLLFQHIPVPEIYNLLTDVPEGTEGAIRGYRVQSDRYYVLNTSVATGAFREPPCSPDTNSGEFDAWLRHGDILGAYFGHDHVNDFAGKLEGIDLGYTPGAGFYQYGPGVDRGVRIFDLDANDPQHYKTELLYYKELVSQTAGTSIYDPYFNSALRIAIPLLLSIIIVFMLIALFATAIVKKVRANRGITAKGSDPGNM